MLTVKTVEEVRQALQPIRGERRIGFVPTMGALHGGHQSLIRTARRESDYVVVSIFVNPIQFGPNEDFNKYPRPIEKDLALCEAEGADLVFNPAVAAMYPREQLTTVSVAKMTEKLCGAFRPGHFNGVTTVVTKLFNIVGPDIAFFGQKDAQQAFVIERMVADLNQPVKIRICPTVRESSGLAMSSRNQYLSESQRQQATCLYRSLQEAAKLIGRGIRESAEILAAMRHIIETAGPCTIEYIGFIDPETFADVELVDRRTLIALAVRIGPARLIDNIIVDGEGNIL